MCNENVIADLVPVDIVINLMITAAWKTAMSKQCGLNIYNCVTGEQKPVTWGRFVNLSIENMRKHPLGMQIIWILFFFCFHSIFFRGSFMVSNWNPQTKPIYEHYSCYISSLHSCLHT